LKVMLQRDNMEGIPTTHFFSLGIYSILSYTTRKTFVLVTRFHGGKRRFLNFLTKANEIIRRIQFYAFLPLHPPVRAVVAQSIQRLTTDWTA
jgi:hypothetical protein